MTDPATTDTLPESLRNFSLSTGGPLTTLLNRFGGGASPGKRAVILAALAWFPVAVLTAAFTHELPAEATSVNVRLLVSLPLLIVVEPFVEGRLRACLRQLYRSRVLEPPGRLALPILVERTERLMASSRVDVLLALVSLGMSLSVLLPLVVYSGRSLPEPARVYFLLISFPLFRFALLRWVWRFLMWALLLSQVARLPLRPRVTHPDRAGGLAFFGRLQGSFGAVILGLSFTVAAMMRLHLTTIEEPPTVEFAPLLVFAGLSVMVIYAPLLVFLPVLLHVRRTGVANMSLLAARHSRRFEQTWFEGDQDPLGTPDMSSLIDLGSSYDVAVRMRLVPMSLRSTLGVVACALAPAVPILVKEGQLVDLLIKIGGSLM